MSSTDVAVPELLIISVNYKTAELAIESIASVMADAAQLPAFEFYVIDNCSGDGSAEKISAYIEKNALNDRVKLTALDVNAGYAFGNNVALKQAWQGDRRPRYCWLLNPDTKVYPGAGQSLMSFLDGHPKAGICVSRLEDEDGTPQVSAFRFPSALNEFLSTLRLGVLDRLFPNAPVPIPVSDEPHECEWVAGASLMMKAEVIDDIGFMDDDYFLYFEELDHCLQAKRAGWQCWYVPESRVFHVVGAATGISDLRKRASRRPQYWFNSRRRYFVKNYSKPYALLADVAALAGFGLWRIRQKLERKPDLDPPHFFRDLLRNSVIVRGFNLQDGDGDMGLWPQIHRDWDAHGRDWTKPGFRAMAIYRFGVWRMGVEPKLLRAPLSVLYRVLYRRARNVWGIEVPYSAQIGQKVVIEHQGGIVVHGASVIGDGCILRQGVTLGNRRLDRPDEAPVLGKNVNVGAGAVITGLVHIGDDAVIGANAVVLKDVPERHMALGVPATSRPLPPAGDSE